MAWNLALSSHDILTSVTNRPLQLLLYRDVHRLLTLDGMVSAMEIGVLDQVATAFGYDPALRARLQCLMLEQADADAVLCPNRKSHLQRAVNEIVGSRTESGILRQILARIGYGLLSTRFESLRKAMVEEMVASKSLPNDWLETGAKAHCSIRRWHNRAEKKRRVENTPPHQRGITQELTDPHSLQFALLYHGVNERAGIAQSISRGC